VVYFVLYGITHLLLTKLIMAKTLQKEVSAEHVDAQWERLLKVVKETFADDEDRVTKMTMLYTDMESRIRSAPASGRFHYHNAYPGGYLDHILNVLDCTTSIAVLYKKVGGEINFTKAELVFAALNHDLGKLGDEDGPYYVTQTSDWHRDKMGEFYKTNPEIPFMTVTDRAFYLLQLYGIQMTKHETIALRLADGMYEEANVRYLKNNEPFAGKTNLSNILHWGDMMATSIERDEARLSIES